MGDDGASRRVGSRTSVRPILTPRPNSRVRRPPAYDAAFRGHTGSVCGALVMPDAKRVLSWSDDGTLRLWWLDGRPAAEPILAHVGGVFCAIFVPDGRILSWGRTDRTLQFWHADGAPSGQPMTGHTDDGVGGALVLPDERILSWSNDCTLRLWRPDGTADRQPIEVPGVGINHAILLSDGRVLCWGGNTLHIWNWAKGAALLALEGHAHGVEGALELPDGGILSWDRKGGAYLWRAAGTARGEPLGAHVRGALILPDQRILSWEWGGALRFWDCDGREGGNPLPGHDNGTHGARVLADGRIVSWGADETIRVWRADGSKDGSELAWRAGRVAEICLLPDGRIVSLGDRSVCVWRVDGTQDGGVMLHRGRVGDVLALPNGCLLSWEGDAPGSQVERTLWLWSLARRTSPPQLGGHDGEVVSVLRHADRYFLTWGGGRTLSFWGESGDVQEKPFASHDDLVFGACSLVDGRVLSWSRDDTFRFWTKDGKLDGTVVVAGLSPRTVLVLPAGRILWCGGRSNTPWILNPDGSISALLVGHQDLVRGLLQMPDGRFLSWSNDGTLRLWHQDGTEGGATMVAREPSNRFVNFNVQHAEALPDGTILSQSSAEIRLWHPDGTPAADALVGADHDGIRGATALPDGRILSWTGAGTLRIWSGEGFAKSIILEGHRSPILGARLTPTGHILSWDEDGGVRRWDADGRPLSRGPTGHNGEVLGATTTQDGFALTWGLDRTVRIWGPDGSSLGVVDLPSDPLKVFEVDMRSFVVVTAAENFIAIHDLHLTAVLPAVTPPASVPTSPAFFHEKPKHGGAAAISRTPATAKWTFSNDVKGAQVRVVVSIRERDLAIHLTIRKNSERMSPAVYLFEIIVEPGGGANARPMASIRSIVFRRSEDDSGTRLTGAIGRGADGFFWATLSEDRAETGRSVNRLRDYEWIDFAFIYDDGQHGNLTLAKGEAGRTVVNRAFVAWGLAT